MILRAMFQSYWLYSAFSIVTLSLIAPTLGRSVDVADDADVATGMELPGVALMAVLVGVGAVVCAIVLLMGCTDLCQNMNSGFKDFDNEDSVGPDMVPPSHAAEFTMYPPAESSPEVPIIFEPLPDINMKMRPAVSNASILRPKVSVVSPHTLERSDSDENLPELTRDPMQDKMKLQNLLKTLENEGDGVRRTTVTFEEPEARIRKGNAVSLATSANSRNLLPRSQLQYIKELGTGYFGKVLQGEGQKILPGHKKTKVVIQMLNEEADPHDQLTFLQEATPYREVDHPNVLKVLGQCVETMPYLVVLELCPFGELKTYLRSHRVAIDSFNEKGLLLKFACDMAAGLQALHQMNFVHHDFATRNCQLASDLTVKIGDYGLSEELFKEDYYLDANGDPIPIRWLAPETLHYTDEGSLNVRHITKECNIWSYGVALWETVMFGSLPYSDLSNDHVLRLVVKERSIKLPKPDMPITHMDRLYQLMQLCWSSEPSQRPSLRELRIMLLHLMSRKTNLDSTAFEQKWNQLMPRKAVPQKTDPLTNGAVPATASAQPYQATSRPGGGFESNFVELDASRLAQHGGYVNVANDISLADELAAVHGKPVSEITEVPVNELSLAEELGAMSTKKPTDDDDVPPLDLSNGDSKNETLTEKMIDVSVNDDTSNRSIPDIVATSTIQSEHSPDFITSTPKGKGDDTTDNMVSANSSAPASQMSSEYHTALAEQTGDQSEDPLFEQKKFAALLQTVAGVSFDGDDYDGLSSSYESNPVFEDMLEKLNDFNPPPKEYHKVPSEDDRKQTTEEPPAEESPSSPQGAPLLDFDEPVAFNEGEKC